MFDDKVYIIYVNGKEEISENLPLHIIIQTHLFPISFGLSLLFYNKEHVFAFLRFLSEIFTR